MLPARGLITHELDQRTIIPVNARRLFSLCLLKVEQEEAMVLWGRPNINTSRNVKMVIAAVDSRLIANHAWSMRAIQDTSL